MLSSPAKVPELPVDLAAFREQVSAGRPAILRGAASHWPAVAAGRESALALARYLGDLSNDIPGETWFGEPAMAGRFDFIEGYDGLNHQRKLSTVAQTLDLLVRQLTAAAPWSVYAGALPLAKHLPDFLAHNPPPAVLGSGVPMLASLWLGNRTRTAAHWDLPSNLACVIGGRRRFLLFPPDQVANLYVGPLDLTLAGQPSSQVDVEHPDLSRHPRYRDALAAAQQAELEPGDAIYVPSLWWHAVTAPDPFGAMVNFWWREGERLGETPMMALLHTLLSVRLLPEKERQAWASMFQHYAFADDPDLLEHIPPARRGVLASLDPEQTRLLKDRLIRSLR